MTLLAQNKYLILRRLVQVSALFLFFAGNAYGWKILQGNFSSSLLFGVVTLVDPYALLQVLATGTLVAARAFLGGAVVLLFFMVIAGRAFCGWICPVNMVTDLADSVRTAFGIKALSLHINRSARYWALVLGLVLSSSMGIAAFEWISPISALHRGIIFSLGMGWTVVAAVFLFDLFMVKNGFCGHLCPLGGFYSFIGRWNVLRVSHDSGRCTQCMKCTAICPEPQVLTMVGKETAFVGSGECTNCGRCVDVCIDGAMRFGLRIVLKKYLDTEKTDKHPDKVG